MSKQFFSTCRMDGFSLVIIKALFDLFVMDWLKMDSLEVLEDALRQSDDQPILVYKHSTRCSISRLTQSRLEGSFSIPNVLTYMVDVVLDRDVSNHLAENLAVVHESPQVLLIHKGKCIYDNSHLAITSSELKEQIEKVKLSRPV